ncbi:probable prefoldin subunit 5 isoform X1 [Lolium rigidum]|uniref:probable prefoldin subunit 5 isoform X1 n=1 Tax=Lolium rigidum TaxID=89674 RepID=UPI001F5DACAC|nr:probable prefoldin subunit 5 isoform X1 [Lolium rigidum]
MASPARIEVDKLSVEQLKALKEQTDLEVNLLQDSLTKIRTAATRLENATAALHELSLRPHGTAHPTITLSSPQRSTCARVLSLVNVFVSDSACAGKKLLVPLTASLYVPGTLDDAEKVLVDVGTGYFIEKTMTQGKEYCERKINLLKSNFDELLEMATKKKSIADEMGMLLQAKLRQASASPSS